MSNFMAKKHHIPPDPLAGFKGPTSMGKKRKGREGMGRKGTEKEGKGGQKSTHPLLKFHKYSPGRSGG